MKSPKYISSTHQELSTFVIFKNEKRERRWLVLKPRKAMDLLLDHRLKPYNFTSNVCIQAERSCRERFNLKSNVLSNKVISDRLKCCEDVLHDGCLSLVQRKRYGEPQGSFPQAQGILEGQSCQLMKSKLLSSLLATLITPNFAKTAPCLSSTASSHCLRNSESARLITKTQEIERKVTQSERSRGFSRE